MTRLGERRKRFIVKDTHGREWALELGDVIRIKPLGARWGGKAEASIGYGALYCRAYQLPRRKHKVTRGLLGRS